MACRRHLAIVLSACLLSNAFAIPADFARNRRGFDDNELDSSSETTVTSSPLIVKSSTRDDVTTSTPSTTTEELDPFKDDDDDDDDDFDDDVFSEPMQTSNTGSSIFSLLRLAGALFPTSTGGNQFFRYLLQEIIPNNQGFGFHKGNLFLRRHDVGDNEIEIDDTRDLKPPPFQRQETEENSTSESDEDSNGDDDNNSDEENFDDDNDSDANERTSEEDNDDSKSNEDDYDDEPPEGDGQGGGILGILAGLSGGEDGQSDLGSLLATVSGIVVNLSGDGFDLNALIASALGLFVGLLSEGDENPGATIASYLLTSLDTITGGGAKNNGAFFGKLVSKLVKGTSAAGDPDASPEEGAEPMADSAGFLLSLIMSLLGDMSKSSSAGSSAWRRSLQTLEQIR